MRVITKVLLAVALLLGTLAVVSPPAGAHPNSNDHCNTNSSVTPYSDYTAAFATAIVTGYNNPYCYYYFGIRCVKPFTPYSHSPSIGWYKYFGVTQRTLFCWSGYYVDTGYNVLTGLFVSHG